MHGFPHILQNRLIKNFNAPQPFSCAVTLCQSLQDSQLKLHFLRLLGPFAHAADSAVVKAVLAIRGSVKVNKNLKPISLCPVKGIVQLLNTADKWLSVSEDKIRNRNTDGIHSHSFNSCEIPLCDVLGPVHFNTGLIHFL